MDDDDDWVYYQGVDKEDYVENLELDDWGVNEYLLYLNAIETEVCNTERQIIYDSYIDYTSRIEDKIMLKCKHRR